MRRPPVLLLVLLALALPACGGGRQFVRDTNSGCSLCHGRGSYTCPTCRGGGQKLPCDACKGRGVTTCASCVKPCVRCLQTGKVRVRGQETVCPVCEGRGLAPVQPEAGKPAPKCAWCDGTRTEPCPKCDATGKLSCPRCGGKGVMDCGVWKE